MTFAESTLRWQRWLLAAMLFGSAVVILPAAAEPFMLPKATLLVVLAVALLALGAARAIWARRVHVPVSLVTAAVGVFLLALVLATLTSPTPLSSVIGLYSRYSGLALYLVYLIVFVVTLRVTTPAFLQLVARTAVVALGFIVAYGLVQYAGLEPFDYKGDLVDTFSFLGNVNFSAAWAASVAALAVTTALASAESRAWRIGSATVLALTVPYVFFTRSFQGPVVLVVSVGWVALVLATAPRSRVRRMIAERRGPAVAVGGVGLLALTGLLVAALPRLRSELSSSLSERLQFWAAARSIVAEHPVLGTGLDTYGHHFQAFRPASHAVRFGMGSADAPHSVPLGMFSNGGVLLGVSYLAVVAVVGVILVRGVWGADGATRIGLAGFGGVWLGYQVQSLVSFDVPPLALLHWLAAGVIVALAAPPTWRKFVFPGQAAGPLRGRKGQPSGAYVTPTSTRVLQGVVVVLALAVVWVSAYPLRADLAAASGAPLTETGQYDQALERFERAAALNPTEATYSLLAARSHEAAGRREQAFETAVEAARRDPGTVGFALYAAQQARLGGMREEAVRWYREAVERDPLDPPVLNEAAGYLLESGQVDEAAVLAQRSADLRTEAGTLVLLGQARLAQQDPNAARAAAEQALALDPASETAKRLLSQIINGL